MRNDYTPYDWYWIINDDETRFWSSISDSYVDTLPLGSGLTRISSETELADVLSDYGLNGPTTSVPKRVTAAQAKLALDHVEILDDVIAVIDAHPVRAVKIWFNDANEWERNHPYITALGIELGLDDEMIDTLFKSAKAY